MFLNFNPVSPVLLFGGIWGIIVAFLTVIVAVGLIVYLLTATAFFCMYRKAKVSLPWLAYIPVARLYPYFKTIQVSQWNWLWLIAPFVGVIAIVGLHLFGIVLCVVGAIVYLVVSIRWLARLLKAFGVSPLWLLGLIGLLIPFLNGLVGIGLLVLYCVLGFNKDIRYHPSFDQYHGSGDSFTF